MKDIEARILRLYLYLDAVTSDEDREYVEGEIIFWEQVLDSVEK